MSKGTENSVTTADDSGNKPRKSSQESDADESLARTHRHFLIGNRDAVSLCQ